MNDETHRLSKLTGEFADAELEQVFRRDTWREWIGRVRLIATAGALFFLAGSVVDWLLLGPGRRVLLLLGIRVGVATILIITLLAAARSGQRTVKLDLTILCATVAVALATTWIVFLSPGELMLHTLTVLVLLLIYYLFTPVRMVHATIAGAVCATSFAVVGVVRFDPSSNELALVLLYLVLINVLGAFGSRLVNHTRRNEYLLLQAERAAHTRLRSELQARRHVEDALAESELRYRSLVELSPYAILVHRQGILLYVNPTGVRLIGATSAEELLGQQTLDFALPEYRERALARLRVIETDGESQPNTEIKVRCLDGRIAHCDVVSGPTVFEGEPAIQSVISDIADRKELEEELRRLATTDPLTGAFNRRHFFEHFDTEWARARRHRRPLSVLMIDIDDFKDVNDRYGHAVGDVALKAVVEILQHVLRTEDVLARMGGDEFAALLAENDLEGARVTAERVRDGLTSARIASPDGSFSLTVSIGVAQCMLDSGSPDACLNRADHALYAAKHAGRDTVRVDRG